MHSAEGHHQTPNHVKICPPGVHSSWDWRTHSHFLKTSCGSIRANVEKGYPTKPSLPLHILTTSQTLMDKSSNYIKVIAEPDNCWKIAAMQRSKIWQFKPAIAAGRNAARHLLGQTIHSWATIKTQLGEHHSLVIMISEDVEHWIACQEAYLRTNSKNSAPVMLGLER